MTKKSKNSAASSFVNNIFIMSSAPIVTQMISFVLMPIIARLYSPNLFGLFNVFASLIGPLLSFSNLGYHHAIVLPKKDQDAVVLVYGNLAISIIVSIFILFIVLLIPESIWFNLNIHSLRKFWWTIPVTILLHGVNISFSGWNQRKTNYNVIAASRVLNAIVNKGYLIIFGLAGYATTGSLILGSLIGVAAMTLLQMSFFSKKTLFFSRYKEVISTLKKYKKFPLFIMSSDLVYRITSAVIFILLVSYFSETVAGYYGMAIMITAVPSILIGTSIGEVFYQKAATEKNAENSNEIYIQLFSKLVKISIFPFIILAIISNELFIIFLGAEWQQAGIYTQILCFQMFIAFIMSPILSLAKVYNKQEYSLIEQILILIMSLAAIIIGGTLNNINIAIALLSLLTGCVTLFFGLLIFYVTNVSSKKIIGIMMKYTFYCVPLVLPLVIVKSFYSSSNIGILIVGFFCFVIHYAILLKTDKDLSSLFKNTITKLRLFNR